MLSLLFDASSAVISASSPAVTLTDDDDDDDDDDGGGGGGGGRGGDRNHVESHCNKPYIATCEKLRVVGLRLRRR